MRADRLEALTRRLQAQGAVAHAVTMGVTEAASVIAAFDHMEEVGGPVDVVVNNAAVGARELALSHSEAQWDQVLDTNLKGAWLAATEAAGRLVEAKRPRQHHQHRIHPR